MVLLSGQTDRPIQDSLTTITLRELENINGLMEDHFRESGEIIRCMEGAFFCGRITGDMKVNMWKIRNKEWALSSGLMDASILGNGIMVNSMEWVRSWQLTVNNVKVNGTKASGLDG
jgi:hypothetical protein